MSWRAEKQNERLRKWFKKITGLESDFLSDHMKYIEEKMAEYEQVQESLLKALESCD